MFLTYQNICIRNALKEDCEQLANWWNDGTIMEHAGFPNGLNTSASEIYNKIKLDSDETTKRLIIEYNKLSIGEMVYINQGNEIVEIGIKICNSNFQDKGLGKVILSMLIKELFNQNYKKIVLDTNLNNTRAQHVYEKLGFMKVATHINYWKDQLGNLQSVVEYELTSDKFVEFV